MRRHRANAGRRSRAVFALLCLCVLGLTAFAGGGATSAAADGACPNEAIREAQRSTQLPACRAYEKVTPAYKGTVDFVKTAAYPSTWSAPDGEHVLFRSEAAFAGSGSGAENYYLSSRGSLGWGTTSITPSDAAGEGKYVPQVLSDDLTKAAVDKVAGGLFGFPPLPNTFGVGPIGGPYTVLASEPLGPYGSDGVQGGDADLDHVVLAISGADLISPPAVGLVAGRALYEAVDGQLRLASVRSDGSLFECGAELATSVSFGFSQVNTVSADGSRIFFRSPTAQSADPSCETPTRLYVRENGTTTVEVSAPQGFTDPTGPYPIEFVGAPRDGSTVYFVTKERLLPGVVGNETHLYQYSFDTEELTHITGGPDGTGTGSEEAGIVRVTDDGSTLFFSAESPILPGKGVAGKPNLYKYDVVSGEYDYIATLSLGDRLLVAFQGQPNPVAPIYPSPGGKFLLFQSDQHLTPESPPSGSPFQLYRYSAASGAIDCISCPPLAATPSPDFPSFTVRTGSSLVATRYPTPMSSDGATVLFETSDPLAAKDTNGKRDVYEWHEGIRRLISTGISSEDSFMIGLSTDGRDALFGTREPLLPADQDSWTDIYDARIGGGFVEPEPKAPCGDDCQGESDTVPAASAVGSSSFAGKGNLPRSKARKLLLKAVTQRQRQRLVRTGRLTLTVKTPGPGLLKVRMKAVVNGRNETVDRASRRLSQGGTTHLLLRLPKAARDALQKTKKLRVSVLVSFDGLRRSETMDLKLLGREG